MAKEVACLQTLHGWSLALNLYASENENRLLLQHHHPVYGWYCTWEPWMEKLGYVESRDMFRCPANEEKGAADVVALEQGMPRLGSLPLSLRLIRELHETLMCGVQSDHATPGEFRRSQNWDSPQQVTWDHTVPRHKGKCVNNPDRKLKVAHRTRII